MVVILLAVFTANEKNHRNTAPLKAHRSPGDIGLEEYITGVDFPL